MNVEVAIASDMVSVRIRPDLKAALVAEAREGDRSMAKQLERILRERYGSALAEEGGAATPGRTDSEARYRAQDHGEPEVPVAPSSASADRIAAAGTDGKSSHTDSPPTAAAKRGASRRASPPAGGTPEPGFRPDFKGGK